MDSLDFQVERQNLKATRFVTTALPELEPGQVLLAIAIGDDDGQPRVVVERIDRGQRGAGRQHHRCRRWWS